MDILIPNLLSESIFDLGRWSNGKYTNTRICLFSVWPLPKVENWFWKQIWNENVHISILIFFEEFWSIFRKVKNWIFHCNLKKWPQQSLLPLKLLHSCSFSLHSGLSTSLHSGTTSSTREHSSSSTSPHLSTSLTSHTVSSTSLHFSSCLIVHTSSTSTSQSETGGGSYNYAVINYNHHF